MKFCWEPFQVAYDLKFMMDFSKISEKARPNVALMVNFVEFSEILLNSNHNTTEK